MKKIFVLFQLLCYSLLINGEIIEVNGINYELNQKDESAKVVSNPYYYSGDIIPRMFVIRPERPVSAFPVGVYWR